MTTNIGPVANGSPFDDEGPVTFPSRRTSVIDHGDVTRLLESQRKPSPKSLISGGGKTNILKTAEGKEPTAGTKLKKGAVGKNLAKEAKKKKKKGSFGEVYEAAKAPNKGIRVTESRHFRESVSANDIRDMLQKSLREKFPPPKPSEGPTCGSIGYYDSPYVQDVFPEDHMVVWKMKDVLWGADYSIDKSQGKAKLSNIRRVETKYVDVGDDESASDDDMRESAPKGWEGTVKHMKKHKDIDNPYALANYMKDEGDTPHH